MGLGVARALACQGAEAGVGSCAGAFDRLAVQAHTGAAITPSRLEAFSKLMCEKLDTADIQARKVPSVQ